MRYFLAPVLQFFVLLLGSMTFAASESHTGCVPPANFKDTPHPPIAAPAMRASRVEQIIINRSLVQVSAAMSTPLDKAVRPSDALPGVAGDYMLTSGVFGAPGSRHIVCLTDGGSVEEESLERSETNSLNLFKYVVWNYQTPKARPVSYAVGEFRTEQLDPTHTRITWIYSFGLKDNVFPGELGSLGRYLFRVGFLDRDYAKMMRGVLVGYKTAAEIEPSG